MLLSCSHAYHGPCLAAFEAFKLGDGPCCCPVCRQNYEKRVWREGGEGRPAAAVPPPPPGASAAEQMEAMEARIALMEAEMFMDGGRLIE